MLICAINKKACSPECAEPMFVSEDICVSKLDFPIPAWDAGQNFVELSFDCTLVFIVACSPF